MKKINIFTATMTIWEMYVLAIFKNANGSAEVLEENNFYPFGLKHEGYNAQPGNPSYNYEYSGKEFQKETGWSDFGARMYMADIGRWGVIDPLAETTTRINPYNYALNNPVMFIDPDGRKVVSSEPMEAYYKQGGLADFFIRGGYSVYGSYSEFLGESFFYQSYNSSTGAGRKTEDRTPKGNGDPNSNIFKSIGNFFNKLFGKAKKDAQISTFMVGATVTRWTLEVGELTSAGASSLEGLGTGVISVGGMTLGALLMPTMIKEPEFNWTRSFDVPTDLPITTTGEPQDPTLYLYRNMLAVGNIPALGQNRFTLGIRPLDIGGKVGTEYVYPSSLDGLSTTLGIGNSIPLNVPNATDKTTLFRINAATLPAQGLIPAPIEGNYYRVIPAYRMTAQEFNFRIQATAPLWTPVR